MTEHGFKNATTRPDWIRRAARGPGRIRELRSRLAGAELRPSASGRVRPRRRRRRGSPRADRMLDVAQHGPLPPTKITNTPSHGHHVFYRWPADSRSPLGDELFGYVTRWARAGPATSSGPAASRDREYTPRRDGDRDRRAAGGLGRRAVAERPAPRGDRPGDDHHHRRLHAPRPDPEPAAATPPSATTAPAATTRPDGRRAVGARPHAGRAAVRGRQDRGGAPRRLRPGDREDRRAPRRAPARAAPPRSTRRPSRARGPRPARRCPTSASVESSRTCSAEGTIVVAGRRSSARAASSTRSRSRSPRSAASCSGRRDRPGRRPVPRSSRTASVRGQTRLRARPGRPLDAPRPARGPLGGRRQARPTASRAELLDWLDRAPRRPPGAIDTASGSAPRSTPGATRTRSTSRPRPAAGHLPGPGGRRSSSSTTQEGRRRRLPGVGVRHLRDHGLGDTSSSSSASASRRSGSSSSPGATSGDRRIRPSSTG